MLKNKEVKKLVSQKVDLKVEKAAKKVDKKLILQQ